MANKLYEETAIQDIADAIREKASSSDTYKVAEMGDAIRNIAGGGDISEYFEANPETIESNSSKPWASYYFFKKMPDVNIGENVKSLAYTFSNYYISVLPKINCTNSVTDMGNMFHYCQKADTVDLSGLNVENVTTMERMFENSYFKTLEFGENFRNTQNLSRINDMFYNCANVEKIDISNFDLTNVTVSSSYYQELFRGCLKLKEVILPERLPSNTNFLPYRWFYSCKSLIKVVIPAQRVFRYSSTFDANCYHFKGTVDSTYNPEGLKDGKIYVPDDLVDSYKTASGWLDYADCIFGMSELEE